MIYQNAADLIVLVHFAFLLFVVSGGFFTLRWRRLAWFHLPAALWGVLMEFNDWACPLTWLEKTFRRLSGGSGYSGGFIDHYVLPLIYPVRSIHYPIEQGRLIQVGLGFGILAINCVIYGIVFFLDPAKRKK